VTLFADTSFWFGLFTPKDHRHAAAKTIWEGNEEQVVTTNLVVGETWTLLLVRRTSHPLAMQMIESIDTSPRVEISRVGSSDEARAWEWLRRHDERTYSFVDATSFVTMRRRRLSDALAFDGNFAAAGFVEVRP
jgi:predicted nucleic acid-binding protein